jgi:hypothetical protein
MIMGSHELRVMSATRHAADSGMFSSFLFVEAALKFAEPAIAVRCCPAGRSA